MNEKSRWQKEFDALPEWAQKMVRALAGCGCYGSGHEDAILVGMSSDAKKKYSGFFVGLKRDMSSEWFDGFCGMKDLAAAMTAPWPPPSNLPPHEQMTTSNIVEMIADDDCAFDQPCYFGHRVEGHAVYCHNDAWPDSPRKCYRNRTDFRHEDCPGFVGNDSFTK